MKKSAKAPVGSVSIDRINYLNVGLMLMSLLFAYILPVELFLFVYAVLGPLHYLTEISWLEKKSYFLKSGNDLWIFLVLLIPITIGTFAVKSSIHSLVGNFIFASFLYALIILVVEKTSLKLLLVAVSFLLSLMFNFSKYPGFPFILFAIWLPTIVHVFLFTGLFILFGALKSRSTSGIISLVCFVACAVSFFIYRPESIGAISEYGKKTYIYFRALNISLYQVFGFGDLRTRPDQLFLDPSALAIMRFIAFSYTYHYLNWFSKTTVIRWNEVSKTRLSIISILWILSVSLYIFNYKMGIYVLFLLSMLHVVLEFPLNHQTFLGIGTELKSIFLLKERKR